MSLVKQRQNSRKRRGFSCARTASEDHDTFLRRGADRFALFFRVPYAVYRLNGGDRNLFPRLRRLRRRPQDALRNI